MTTVVDVDLSTWNRYPSSPRLRGSDPFGANLISVGQAVESDLAQSIAGGDVIAAYTPSADSRLIYVSTSGNDGTGASTTIAAQTDAFDPQGTVLPYLTLAAAFAQARDGFPDWVLLKRGDTWTGESVVPRAGRGVTEPYLISYYGTTGDRPILKMGADSGINLIGLNDYLTIYGIDFYSHLRDPADGGYTGYRNGGTGLRFVGGGKNLTLDDCIVRWFYTGLIVQKYDGDIHEDVVLRRCIVHDCHGREADGHSQGSYFDGVDGLLIEECFYDYNGWHSDVTDSIATQYNHNLYIQYNCVGNNITVRNNIITRGSSHGVHGRPGGLYEENLFVENSISLQLGYQAPHSLVSGTDATAQNNVILSGKRMDLVAATATTAVWGLNVDPVILDFGGTASVINNIVANRKESGNNVGIRTVAGVTYTTNVVYDWQATEDMTNGAWTHSGAEIPEYMTSIGETATLQAFLDIQRARPLNVYSGNYTSLQANNYFRAGFDR